MPSTYLARDVVWGAAWWAPFASVLSVYALQLACTASLLSPKRGRMIRTALLPLALYFVVDITFNAHYTFGSRLRDTGLGSLAWLLCSGTLVAGLTYDVPRWLRNGKGTSRVPQWCVPDWSAEKGDEPQASLAPPVHWWQRTPVPARPTWARRANVIPRHWRLLPYPTRLIDQALWTIDVITIRRYGTSTLFAQEMRTLDWSRAALEQAGQAHHAVVGEGNPPSHPQLQPFGYIETPLRSAMLDTALVAWALRYLTYADVPGSSYADFYRLPFTQQATITVAFGVMLSMPTTLLEYLTLPLWQRPPFNVPATALIPRFRDVGRSQSITELWSWRWHSTYKRDLVSLARLLPPYTSAPSTSALDAVLLMVKVFAWSGVMHSMVIARVLLSHPTTIGEALFEVRKTLFLPACTAFFLSQAVLVVVEQSFGAWWRKSGRQLSPTAMFVARNAWVWLALLFTGHLLAAETVAANVLTQSEIQSMRPSAQLRDYYHFFCQRLLGSV